jgi:hypothetical protein
LSGALFVVGSIGVEIIGTRHAVLYGQPDPVYASLVFVEESLEMTGVAIFLVALLQYAGTEIGLVQIQFDRLPSNPAVPPGSGLDGTTSDSPSHEPV